MIRAMWRPVGPGHQQDAHGDDDQHRRRAEVGLDEHEPDGHAPGAEGGHEAGERQVAAARSWRRGTPASTSTSTTFANSDGCSWNGPTSNHASAPLRARATTSTPPSITSGAEVEPATKSRSRW